MQKFIKLCVAVILLSFIAVPIYYGVSKEHEKIIPNSRTSINEPLAALESPELSFDEIYAIASQEEFSPENLNNITPAAGGNIQNDSFSSGFNAYTDTNL